MKKNQNQKKQNHQAINLFGNFIRIPMVFVYCVSSVLVGLLVGFLASIVLPVFIPYQMIKIKFFKSGS